MLASIKACAVALLVSSSTPSTSAFTIGHHPSSSLGLRLNVDHDHDVSSSLQEQHMRLMNINRSDRNQHQLQLQSRLRMASAPTTTTTKTSMTSNEEESSEAEAEEESKAEVVLPEPDKNGIYVIKSKEEHISFLEKYADQIIVMKFYAPWCRACKGLEPKYIQTAKDPKYAKLPLKFAQLSVANNKEYIKSLGILALPSVHIYASKEEGLVENFPCGPSKVPILKKKIAQVVNSRVDPKTRTLKPFQPLEEKEAEACTERSVSTDVSSSNTDETQLKLGDVVVSEETMTNIRTKIPYFKDFTDEEFKTLMSKSVYSTFEAGSVIMKQGKPGRTFYIIDDGEVEISVKGAFEDPLTTPSGYLGAVVNRLKKSDYFGERSLITGEPRAASIRTIGKTRCFTFDIDDIPKSSVLSGKSGATQERLKEVDDKYAVDYYNINFIDKQFVDVAKANQVKASPNGPSRDKDQERSMAEGAATKANEDAILSLLVRFKLLRQAARCFEYISKTSPRWGDEVVGRRRSLLVSKLTPGQQQEFKELFKLIDTSNDGVISILELKNALESIYDEQQSDEKVKEMINKADPSVNGNDSISLNDFMGVMAEAEFYYLFKETFATLDKENSGYVQAYKLDRVLCGLRDLISDDRKSIIDVEDKEMLIDYETFSRMMIGTW
jgi:calmodulin